MKAFLKTAFWLCFVPSALLNVLLFSIILIGLLNPHFHQSPQAPLPLIFIGGLSSAAGFAALMAAVVQKKEFAVKSSLILSTYNFVLTGLCILGTVVWLKL